MKLFDLFNSEKTSETIRKNNISNSVTGAYGSGGSLRKPMYRNVCCDGEYIPTNAKGTVGVLVKGETEKKQRHSSVKNKSVSKFHKGFA